jgi:hypothetical protein
MERNAAMSNIPCQQFDGFPSPVIRVLPDLRLPPSARVIQHHDITIIILCPSQKHNLGMKLACNAP